MNELHEIDGPKSNLTESRVALEYRSLVTWDESPDEDETPFSVPRD